MGRRHHRYPSLAPTAIEPERLARAHRYANLLGSKPERTFAGEYIGWLKRGAIGHEPARPRGITVATAQGIIEHVNAFNLWGDPQA